MSQKHVVVVAAKDEEYPTRMNDMHGRNNDGHPMPPTICVCTRDTKIPRPKNAWILYRQHYQASVVAQYPGLIEPEISKILGENWRNTPQETKDQWKQLAEEEKARHQQAHPDYRYQPRRKGQSNSDADSPTAHSPGRCNKCGRAISMISPTSPRPTSQVRPVLPPPAPATHTRPMSSGRTLSFMNNLSLVSPERRNSRQHPPNINVPPLHNYAGEQAMMVDSPEAKRRRFTTTGGYVPVAGHPNQGPPYAAMSPYRGAFGRTDPSRRWSPTHTGVMAPSARVMHPGPQTRHESLTLPPMQNNNGSGKTVEELIMAMPYLLKIKTLGRISPPLKSPKPPHPPHPIRGSVIAIEGDDPAAVATMVDWLEDTLNRGGEHVVRTAKGPEAPSTGKRVTLKDYLEYMQSWHDKSKEIIEYVTNVPGKMEDVSDHKPTEPNKSSKSPGLLPVLVLHRYHLFASNAYACRTPIGDTYLPNDHWQWMATVWRGIVGPDYTIYIRDVSPEEMAKEKAVDVREDIRCVIVRRVKGPGPIQGNLDEKILRRLGFELGEITRMVNEGKGQSDAPGRRGS